MSVSRAVRARLTALTCATMLGFTGFALTGCSQLLPGASEASALTLTIGAPAVPDGPLLAQLYGQVLQSHSYDVFYNYGLRTREQTLDALRGGMIDFLPDFSGEVLQQLYPEAEPRSSFDVTSEVRQELRSVGLTMLTPSPAENGLAFVSSQGFAIAHNIVSLREITSIQTDVTIAAHPGFEGGESGRAALSRIYGVNKWTYLSIPANDDQSAIDALANGKAQIVVMRATSPLIKLNDLVVLTDPGHVVPANNLIPIMATTTYPRTVEKLVATLSAALTTEQLRLLSAQRAAENAPSDWRIANEWLRANKLLGPAGSL